MFCQKNKQNFGVFVKKYKNCKLLPFLVLCLQAALPPLSSALDAALLVELFLFGVHVGVGHALKVVD